MSPLVSALPTPTCMRAGSGRSVSLLPRCGLGCGVSGSPVCSGRLAEAGSSLFTSPKYCVGICYTAFVIH